MDCSERLAHSYLVSLGIGEVVYEPDGNIPPDFVIDKRIAVEVRRLNKHVRTVDGQVEALEKRAIPLWQSMQTLLPTLGQSHEGESWFVGMNYQRPLSRWKEIQPKIKKALLEFKNGQIRTSVEITIEDNFSIDLTRASLDHGVFFLLGGSSDHDAGGWVVSDLLENLALCIPEKNAKVEKYRAKYPIWWLVFADHIGHGLSDWDQEELSLLMPESSRLNWEKIILIHPNDYTRAYIV